MSFSEKLPELTKEMKKITIIKDVGGDRLYDSDNIGWHLGKTNKEL